MLLDASILMLLGTLMSNKPYLGSARYPWDPIVFGLLLMGVAIAIKRWLASGANGIRHGFIGDAPAGVGAGTARRLQQRGRAVPARRARNRSPRPNLGGGGRSGGAGASGNF